MNGALERRGRDLEIAVMARTAELQAANAKLEQLALRDGLSGLFNRRAMAVTLGELHSLCQRYGNWYSVILLDIDHFKLFNDSAGHLQGDEILKKIGESLEDSVRISDSVYRYGGEEFLVALPDTDGKDTLLVANRIRSKLAALKIPHPDSPTSDCVTVSMGCTSVCSRQTAFLGTWEHASSARIALCTRRSRTGATGSKNGPKTKRHRVFTLGPGRDVDTRLPDPDQERMLPFEEPPSN